MCAILSASSALLYRALQAKLHHLGSRCEVVEEKRIFTPGKQQILWGQALHCQTMPKASVSLRDEKTLGQGCRVTCV